MICEIHIVINKHENFEAFTFQMNEELYMYALFWRTNRMKTICLPHKGEDNEYGYIIDYDNLIYLIESSSIKQYMLQKHDRCH